MQNSNKQAAAKEIEGLLGQLKTLAKKPLDKATTLPKEMYTSEAFLRLEEKEIFYKQWICAGRADAIPNAGDYLTQHLAYQPVIIMRQKSGDVIAYSNVCMHRMMRLLEDTGSCKKIACPYHGWTYDIEGKLIGAPHMADRPKFDRQDYVLPRVRCEVWQGWIYITLNNKIKSVAKTLAPLETLTADYNMANYVHVQQQDFIWTGNWKQLLENFVEGYHLPIVHRKTVGEYFPADETQFAQGKIDPNFTYQTFFKEQGTKIGRAHKNNKSLKGDMRKTSYLFGVFPTHLCVLAPDHLWYISIQPKGTGQIYIRYGVAIAPEVLKAQKNKKKFIKDVTEFLEIVNEEDRFIIEGLYKGAHAPLAKQGPLCWLEQENQEFTQYLARRLVGKKL